MPDGNTRLVHLQAAIRPTFVPPELIAPPLPAALLPLFEFYQVLASGRQSGFGPSPLGWQDFESGCRMLQYTPTAWEVRALRALDGAYVRVMGDSQDSTEG